MKPIYALLFVVTFMAGQTLGQTLAPVASGFDFWPLVFVAVIGLVGFGLYTWHKRNPSKADAAIAAAKSEVMGLGNSALDIAHKSADTIAGLKDVVAKQAAGTSRHQCPARCRARCRRPADRCRAPAGRTGGHRINERRGSGTKPHGNAGELHRPLFRHHRQAGPARAVR
jgi:hypothetical protein